MKRQPERIEADMSPEDLLQGLSDLVDIGLMTVVGEQHGQPIVQRTMLDKVISPYLMAYTDLQQMELFGSALLLVRKHGCSPVEAWTRLLGPDIQTGVNLYEHHR